MIFVREVVQILFFYPLFARYIWKYHQLDFKILSIRAQSIPFIGVTISHTNLLSDENHQIIIIKNPPGGFF